MAWRNGGDAAATDEAQTAPVPANNGGGKLLEGEYDEVDFAFPCRLQNDNAHLWFLYVLRE